MLAIKFCPLLLICVLLGSSTAYAQSYSYKDEGIRIGEKEFREVRGFQIGRAALKVGLENETQYDSNIFLEPSEEKSDYLNITSPSLLLNVPLGIDERHIVQAFYQADAGAFANYKDQNYLNQHALINANWQLPFGFINAQNDFEDTVDRAGTELTDQVHRHTDNSKLTLGVTGNKLSYEGAYAHYMKRYVVDNYKEYSYDQDSYTLTALYQLMPKTKMLLEYEYATIDYIKGVSRNGSYNQIMTGLRGDITGKTVGLVKVGYQTREYREEGQDGFNAFVAEAGLNTKFSERTEMNLKYNKTAVESVYLDNNFYDMNAISWDMRQDLIGHFSVLLSSMYSYKVYPNDTPSIGKVRKDGLVTQGVALQYKLKELAKIKVGYEYAENNSNVNDSDYIRNLVYFKMDFRF